MAMHNPVSFLKANEITREGVKEALHEIQNELCRNEKEIVLDVGCGPGDITSTLLRSICPDNSTIIGADISKEMIDFAKLYYSDKNINFKIIDIMENNLWSTWNKNEFTKIFSFYCLHRVKDQRKAYENIYNLLKPGGELVSVKVVESNVISLIDQFIVEIRKHTNCTKKIPHTIQSKIFAKNTIELLRNIGFEIKFHSTNYKKFLFSSVDEAVDFVVIVSYIQDYLANENITDFYNDIKDLAIKLGLLQLTNEGCFLNYILFTIVARKPLENCSIG